MSDEGTNEQYRADVKRVMDEYFAARPDVPKKSLDVWHNMTIYYASQCHALRASNERLRAENERLTKALQRVVDNYADATRMCRTARLALEGPVVALAGAAP